MKPVAVVIPALGDVELLGRALPALFAEFDARGVQDELIIVDDTGCDELSKRAATLIEARTDARFLALDKNSGFALALEAGVQAAGCSFVFSMNSDVVVRPGFLGPLVSTLEAEHAFAVAPRVLLNGAEEAVESLTRVRVRNGLLDFRSPEAQSTPNGPIEIPFAVGGTFLFDRTRFLELGGFDPLFAPFYFEDVDLCWRAWRRGWQTYFVPDSVVEHHHKGTIGKLITEPQRRSAIERGELLFNWKHLPDRALCDHLAALFGSAVDGYLADDRQALIWLALALEKREAAASSRQSLSKLRDSLDLAKELTRQVC